MNPLQERTKNSFPGMYRAEVRFVNEDKKNGLYKVRAHPVHTGVLDDNLPVATSNLTTRYRHIQLKVGDIVWVFFENADPNFPVIFDLCNFKDSYPKEDIGTYGKYDKMELGDLTIEYDEENKKLKLVIGSNSVEVDGNSNKVNIETSGGKVNLESGKATVVNGANKVEVTSGGVTVTGTMVTITGGSLRVNGMAAPTGSGPFCGLPVCVITGVPHVGNVVAGT